MWHRVQAAAQTDCTQVPEWPLSRCRAKACWGPCLQQLSVSVAFVALQCSHLFFCHVDQPPGHLEVPERRTHMQAVTVRARKNEPFTVATALQKDCSVCLPWSIWIRLLQLDPTPRAVVRQAYPQQLGDPQPGRLGVGTAAAAAAAAAATDAAWPGSAGCCEPTDATLCGMDDTEEAEASEQVDAPEGRRPGRPCDAAACSFSKDERALLLIAPVAEGCAAACASRSAASGGAGVGAASGAAGRGAAGWPGDAAAAGAGAMSTSSENRPLYMRP